MTTEVTNRIINKLAAYCEQHHIVVVVTERTPIADLQLDSLALMEVLYELEEEFEVTLETSSLASLHHVSDLVAAIHRSRKTAA